MILSASIELLESTLKRYLDPSTPVNYLYRTILIEIDIQSVGRIVGAWGMQVYPYRLQPTIPNRGAYPLIYDEVETMLVNNTIDALLMAIGCHF